MNRKQGPPGTAWCSGKDHKRFLPILAFNRDASRWNGLDSMCAACRAKSRQKAACARKPRAAKAHKGGCLSASRTRMTTRAKTRRLPRRPK